MTGALLKFALDRNATDELRTALCGFGVALSCLGLVTCVLGEVLRRAIVTEIREMSTRLMVPISRSSLLPLTFATCLVTAFILVCLAGWLVLMAG